jgi:hypothetical protein
MGGEDMLGWLIMLGPVPPSFVLLVFVSLLICWKAWRLDKGGVLPAVEGEGRGGEA